MGKYSVLKKEFEFLVKIYGFKIVLRQKHGAYYYIIWTNLTKNIMVLYDEQVENPVSIRVYDSDSFSFDAIEYKEEFMQKLAGYGLMFSNFGFMGNAIFLSVFPDIFFEYTLFTLPFWSMAYVWAVPTILIPKENQEANPTLWTRIKPFFNPMLIAVFIGFFIGITGLGSYMPAPVTQVIDSASACMTPVAMILTGITVGNIDVKAMLKKGYLYVITAIRLLVYPLAFLGIIALLNLLPHNAFINATVFKCILCVAAMPMGLTSIFVPAAYGKDVSEAAGLVLFTHVFSVATSPLMFMCLQWIIG